jgi:K+/H+ antiporter YhaU regulatory subunit KhtT
MLSYQAKALSCIASSVFADIGGLNVVEMRYGTSIIAIVGTGEKVANTLFSLLLV